MNRRMTTLATEEELLKFVRDAAIHFLDHPEHQTYGGSPTPGELLALRWGLDENCVLVIKVDADFQPVVFQQAIPK